MQAIVAVDRNYAIGREGGMLFHLPGDLAFFRRQTLGKTLIMGRRTLQSFPEGRPLDKRRNIVLSRNPKFRPEGVEVVADLAALKQALKDTPEEERFVVGGQQVYDLLLPFCDRALLTHIEAEVPADTHFPDLRLLANWQLESCGPTQNEGGVTYRICTYLNSAPQTL